MELAPELAPIVDRHAIARAALTAAHRALTAAELEHQASYDELITALASPAVSEQQVIAAALTAALEDQPE